MANQSIPPQITQKVEAIEKLGFGVMDKIFLAFDKIFWDQVRDSKLYSQDHAVLKIMLRGSASDEDGLGLDLGCRRSQASN